MGTETILQLAGSDGGSISHQQNHHQQQRQHNQVNVPSHLSEGDGAFGGDQLKATVDTGTQPHLDVFGSNHPHIHSPPGGGAKLPPVVGIYRPPAARRALKLAEKAFHHLAPPAACEHPADYNHWPAPASVDLSSNLPVTADKAFSGAHSNEDSPSPPPPLGFGKDEGRAGEKTGLQPEESCGTSNNKCPKTETSLPAANGALGSVVAGECKSAVVSPTNARINRPHRERRPDRAVYIPRARRSLTTPPVTTTTTTSSSLLPAAAAGANETGSKPITNSTGDFGGGVVPPPKKATVVGAGADVPASCPIGFSEVASKSKQKAHSTLLADPGELSVVGERQTRASESSVQICDTVKEDSSQRRTAQPVEAFKRRSYSLEEPDHLQRTLTNSLVEGCGGNVAKKDRLQIVSEVSCDLVKQLSEQQSSGEEAPNVSCCDFQKATDNIYDHSSEEVASSTFVAVQSKVNETNDTMHRNNNRNRTAKNVSTTVPLQTAMIINDRPGEGEKVDRDEKELRRASQEMNRSNRRIMKQTFNSNVLEIDEPPVPPTKKTEKKAAVVTQNGDSGNVSETKVLPRVAGVLPNGKVSNGAVGVSETHEERADDDEDGVDDWESMYDDNGDCLNPKMLEELTSAVGKVSIDAPQSDYKIFETKQAVLNEEEFPHVLEVSNFPAEFKTQDLMMLFSQYKESGFDIKWVDDTHALAVFSSSKIAAEVLAAGPSFAQVKPLAEATAESRAKARKCASSLQPYRARPETCAALARRLVTTALGVRLKTAPEERENERRVLREAKERKLLAAKQRDELWES